MRVRHMKVVMVCTVVAATALMIAKGKAGEREDQGAPVERSLDDQGITVRGVVWDDSALRLTLGGDRKGTTYCKVRFWPEGGRELIARVEAGGGVTISKSFPYRTEGRGAVPVHRMAEVALYQSDRLGEIWEQRHAYLIIRPQERGRAGGEAVLHD